MSNSAVGGIYKRIIDSVVETSRTDFEENGVSSDVLQLLQEKWQQHLSVGQRAVYPWDPEANPPKPKKDDLLPMSSQTMMPVKQEPYDQSFLNLPHTAPYSSGLGQPQLAQQRAAQLMQQQFGHQASNSIGALHASGTGLQPIQRRPSNNVHDAKSTMRQDPAMSSMPWGQEPEPFGDISYSQTDGAGDPSEQWDAVVMQRNARGDEEPLGRIAVDGMIRRQVEAMSQRLEGGGLMVPLEERRPTIPQPRPARKQPRTGPSQLDGAVEDDEEIGSDLDDPEDDVNDEVQADYQNDMILCLYDKVQRVKNKWKCTLKDGVVTVDGKDYVFHKAQGEFEW